MSRFGSSGFSAEKLLRSERSYAATKGSHRYFTTKVAKSTKLRYSRALISKTFVAVACFVVNEINDSARLPHKKTEEPKFETI
jgi:hypothetical protein